MKTNTLLLIYCYCLTPGLNGSENRIRHIDPEMQRIFAANTVTVPLPTRERRGGKKSSTEEGGESNATAGSRETTPPDPPLNATEELAANSSPADFLDRIEELEDEIDNHKAIREALHEDLSAATSQIKSLVQARAEMVKHINTLEDILDEGPGSLFKGWVYSPELKWVYVSPTIVPYSYSQDDGWMLYEYGTNPRRVYYYKTKEWKLLDNEE